MVICFFGDSITNGIGDPQALGWVGRLIGDARAAGHAITPYNLGVRRNSSAAILERFEAEATWRQFPDMPMKLVFAYGVVDCVPEAGLSLDDTVANTKALLTKGAALGEMRFVGPPLVADRRLNDAIAVRSQAMAACCAEAGVPYLDILPALHDAELYLEELVGGDGIHPGAAGYSLIFRLVNAWDAWKDWLEGNAA